MAPGVQLVTYADRLAGDLTGLRRLLAGPLAGFTGVHVLPFFVPFDGVDAGFDPVDHRTVDPRLGSWDDVRALADDGLGVTADLIVNHVSAASPEYRDWVDRGAGSPYAGMFLTFDAVYPGGAREDDVTRVYRPRPGVPFTPVSLGDGSRRLVWTTFEPSQIDLDLSDGRARDYLASILELQARHGVRTVRLDAVGYAIKTAGTDCFLTDDTMRFVDEITTTARGLGLQVLVEVHGSIHQQRRIAPHVDWVYDFALPPLLLHAAFTGTFAPLARWLEVRPANARTVLDTHDGIGIIDVADSADGPGLLTGAELEALASEVAANTGGMSTRASPPIPWSPVPYQLNSTYYDALGGDDDAYLVSRLVQAFVAGVPQIYYVGLLAGGNDVERFERTGVGRDLNRHAFTPAEVTAALERPVVRAVLALVRIRGAHPAFAGQCRWSAPARRPVSTLELRWEAGAEVAVLAVDAGTNRFRVTLTVDGAERTVTDATGLEELAAALSASSPGRR
jgi:sucrose phosphorylase